MSKPGMLLMTAESTKNERGICELEAENRKLREEIQSLRRQIETHTSSRDSWMRRTTELEQALHEGKFTKPIATEMVECGGCGEMVERESAAWKGLWECPECRIRRGERDAK